MASFFLPSTRFSVMMQSALVLLSFISFAVAISDEYKGFLHYHNSDVTQDKILLDASDLKLSGSVWSAVCDDLEECVAFNDAGYLKGFPHNKSVDAYISKKNCGSHGPAKVINGSCLSPNSSYVKCHDDKGHMDTFYNIKATYNLPPNLVAEACRIDEFCVGFMVTNDRQFGSLLEHFDSPIVKEVWTRVPHSRRVEGWDGEEDLIGNDEWVEVDMS